MRLFVNQTPKKREKAVLQKKKWSTNDREPKKLIHASSLFFESSFEVENAQDKGSKMAYTDLVDVKSCDDFIKRNVKIV